MLHPRLGVFGGKEKTMVNHPNRASKKAAAAIVAAPNRNDARSFDEKQALEAHRAERARLVASSNKDAKAARKAQLASLKKAMKPAR